MFMVLHIIECKCTFKHFVSRNILQGKKHVRDQLICQIFITNIVVFDSLQSAILSLNALYYINQNDHTSSKVLKHILLLRSIYFRSIAV